MLGLQVNLLFPFSVLHLDRVAVLTSFSDKQRFHIFCDVRRNLLLAPAAGAATGTAAAAASTTAAPSSDTKGKAATGTLTS